MNNLVLIVILFLLLAAVVAAAVVVGVALSRRRGGAAHPRAESLGNPHPDAGAPLIRPESRHNDTPGASDLDQRGGRH
jgi:hypothetical protein